jgi:hypothetical protein
MTDGGLLAEAVAELYAADPDEFVERRKAHVAKARAAGQGPAAKQIAGLRKPTRSAWIVNRLVRAEPGVPAELGSLGDELRAAQDSLDGAAIRELSQRRRELVESLARRAFAVSGQHAPPAGIRDEVTATLGAALADPQVAGQLAAGTLHRAAHAGGFSSAGPPALALVKGSGGGPARATGGGAAPPAPRARPVRPERPERPERAQHRERGGRPQPPPADELRAERERRRQAALAAAELAAADAGLAAEAATAAEHAAEAAVQSLEEQLADARGALNTARAQARRARSRQRSTRQALDRLRN